MFDLFAEQFVEQSSNNLPNKPNVRRTVINHKIKNEPNKASKRKIFKQIMGVYGMPFWLFKKKRELQPEINVLPIKTFEDSVKLSFFRIKSDIQSIRDWIEFFKNKDLENNQKIKEIDQKLDQITDVMEYTQSSIDTFKTEITSKIEQIENRINSDELYVNNKGIGSERPTLTDTQQAIFAKVVLLLKELGQEWAPFRLLAREIYPDKEYSQIKSTLSEYINILIENNFIKSQRRGKKTYISLTDKGKKFIKEAKKPIKEEIKNKKSKEVN